VQVFSSLRPRVQTGSGAHPAPNQTSTGGSFPGVKLPGSEDDHSSPSAWVLNAWSYSSTLPYVFMAWCLVKRRDFILRSCCVIGNCLIYMYFPLASNLEHTVAHTCRWVLLFEFILKKTISFLSPILWICTLQIVV